MDFYNFSGIKLYVCKKKKKKKVCLKGKVALKEKEHSKQQSKAELMLKASVQLKGRGKFTVDFLWPLYRIAL